MTKREKTVKRKAMSAPRPRQTVQSASPPVEQRIWIYPKGGGFRVHPSPKGVTRGAALFFTNLTDIPVTVEDQNGIAFDPPKLDIPAWNPAMEPEPPFRPAHAGTKLGAHVYWVTIDRGLGVKNPRAEGGSDPDIIINP